MRPPTDKLACANARGHHRAMRRLVLVAPLFIAACVRAPQPQTAGPAPEPVQPQVRTQLAGLTAAELMDRFGRPALQVREGPGLKLQFRGGCVLDAYLYPPQNGGGTERVTHVDARLPSGADIETERCITSLQAP